MKFFKWIQEKAAADIITAAIVLTGINAICMTVNLIIALH